MPELGRWINRDPLGEKGGYNLYAFVCNNSPSIIDPYGLDWLANVSDFSAAVGDSLTFGATRWIRKQLGSDHVVNYSSGSYIAGEAVEFAVETVVTLGGSVLRRTAARYVGRAGRYLLEGGARQSFRRAKQLIGRGGIIHHLNPIRQGRFPLPFTWAARGFWNLKWLPGSTVSSHNRLHRIHHWWLRTLDKMDYVRTWTSPIRTAANEIMRRVNQEARKAQSVTSPTLEREPYCLYAPDITIEQNIMISITAAEFGLD